METEVIKRKNKQSENLDKRLKQNKSIRLVNVVLVIWNKSNKNWSQTTKWQKQGLEELNFIPELCFD